MYRTWINSTRALTLLLTRFLRMCEMGMLLFFYSLWCSYIGQFKKPSKLLHCFCDLFKHFYLYDSRLVIVIYCIILQMHLIER